MLNNLAAAKESIASKLAAAREAHARAAYDYATGKDKATARTRVSDLAKQIEGFEAEQRTIDAAIERSEKLATEERRAEQERAKERAAEEERRSLRAQLQRIEAEVERAHRIDKLIDELGAQHGQWASHLFTPNERHHVTNIIVNRLVAVGVLPHRFITGPLSPNLEIRVADVVNTAVTPRAVELNYKLQPENSEV